MKINPIKFGLACAVTFSLVWIVCSALVMLFPSGMMQMTGGMVHGDLSHLQWDMGISGIIMGLIGWAIVAGTTGGLIAFVYDRLIVAK
jgi:hypothetical protein